MIKIIINMLKVGDFFIAGLDSLKDHVNVHTLQLKLGEIDTQ